MDGAEAILHMCKSQLDGLICAVTGEVPQPPPPLIKNHCYRMEWNGASMSMSMSMIHMKILYTSDLFCAQAGSNDDEWTCQKPKTLSEN